MNGEKVAYSSKNGLSKSKDDKSQTDSKADDKDKPMVGMFEIVGEKEIDLSPN